MSRWHTTKDENFIDAPSRSVPIGHSMTGGGSRTTPRAVLQGYFQRNRVGGMGMPCLLLFLFSQPAQQH